MKKEISALDRQQDGDHYKTLKMQPLELAYRVNGSPCFTKLAKYASRRKVDRLGDLNKAIHCIELEKELRLRYDNRYEKLRVTEPFFHATLCEFTEDENLFSALYHMYYSEYDLAIKSIEGIKLLEGFYDA